MLTCPNPDSPLLTKADVAKRFRCTVKTIERYMKSRQLGYIKFGALVRFEPDDVEALKQKLRVSAK